MSDIMQKNDTKNMLIKIVDKRIKDYINKIRLPSSTVIIKCTQAQYDNWEENGLIDTNKLYGIIIEE